jgi:hypothetical protein
MVRLLKIFIEIPTDNKPTGLKEIVISKASGTADTPRAHVVNPFATGMRQILLL